MRQKLLMVFSEMWGTATGTGSAPSSWHSPAHGYLDNSNSVVDNEFDMLGTRSRSPMPVSSAVHTVPSPHQLSMGMLP